MAERFKTLSELTHQAIELLAQHLGPADTFRFISQCTARRSDYTAERDALFGDLSLDDILKGIERQRPQSGPLPSPQR